MAVDKNFFKKTKQQKSEKKAAPITYNLKPFNEFIASGEEVLLKQKPNSLRYAIEQVQKVEGDDTRIYIDDNGRGHIYSQSFQSQFVWSIVLMFVSLLPIAALIFLNTIMTPIFAVNIMLLIVFALCYLPFTVSMVKINKARRGIRNFLYVVTDRRILFLVGKNYYYLAKEIMLDEVASAYISYDYQTTKKDVEDISLVMKNGDLNTILYAVNDANFICQKLNELLNMSR